jgi:hypothetical protein
MHDSGRGGSIGTISRIASRITFKEENIMYAEYPDEFYDLVDQYVASGRYGGRPEAADAVRRARPDLCPKPAAGKPATMASTGLTAEAQLNAMAKKIAAERGVTFAQAYVAALNENPLLYVQYLREHEAALGARRG